MSRPDLRNQRESNGPRNRKKTASSEPYRCQNRHRAANRPHPIPGWGCSCEAGMCACCRRGECNRGASEGASVRLETQQHCPHAAEHRSFDRHGVCSLAHRSRRRSQTGTRGDNPPVIRVGACGPCGLQSAPGLSRVGSAPPNASIVDRMPPRTGEILLGNAVYHGQDYHTHGRDAPDLLI
jgi:hypothetical protein